VGPEESSVLASVLCLIGGNISTKRHKNCHHIWLYPPPGRRTRVLLVFLAAKAKALPRTALSACPVTRVLCEMFYCQRKPSEGKPLCACK